MSIRLRAPEVRLLRRSLQDRTRGHHRRRCVPPIDLIRVDGHSSYSGFGVLGLGEQAVPIVSPRGALRFGCTRFHTMRMLRGMAGGSTWPLCARFAQRGRPGADRCFARPCHAAGQ